MLVSASLRETTQRALSGRTNADNSLAQKTKDTNKTHLRPERPVQRRQHRRRVHLEQQEEAARGAKDAAVHVALLQRLGVGAPAVKDVVVVPRLDLGHAAVLCCLCIVWCCGGWCVGGCGFDRKESEGAKTDVGGGSRGGNPKSKRERRAREREESAKTHALTAPMASCE